MEKTLREKITPKYKHPTHHQPAKDHGKLAFSNSLTDEQILQEGAKDLLQPRPEAVERLLQLCREL